jgi:hypothetical protein
VSRLGPAPRQCPSVVLPDSLRQFWPASRLHCALVLALLRSPQLVMEILPARWIEMNEVLCVSDAGLDLEILSLRLRAKVPTKTVSMV